MGKFAETPQAIPRRRRRGDLWARPTAEYLALPVTSEPDPDDFAARRKASPFPVTTIRAQNRGPAGLLRPSRRIQSRLRARTGAADRCSAREFFPVLNPLQPCDVRAHAFHVRSAASDQTPPMLLREPSFLLQSECAARADQ